MESERLRWGVAVRTKISEYVIQMRSVSYGLLFYIIIISNSNQKRTSMEARCVLLISIPVLRMNIIREPCAYMCVSSYSKVGAVEQRYMVNSGMRGTKNNHLRTEVDCTSIVPNTYPIII
jgi:hypothetical protein